MIIYLVGLGCVGKTTIGKLLANKIGFTFFDLDNEIEKHFNKPIERIQDQFITMHEYRKQASIVLDKLFSKDINSVIAGTPSGLKFSYYKVYKQHKQDKQLISIFIDDSFENILNRLTFYDKDSNPIIEKLDDYKKKRYLKDIRDDYNYFKHSYQRADYRINIKGIKLKTIPDKIIKEINLNLQ